jgi:sodium/bile acid cotransporter family protein DUF4137
MLDRPTRVPVDTFLVALLAVVTLAALFPATGTAADVLDVATKAAIALLFLLYGVRLSPTEALHGLKHWRLHLLVLAATFRQCVAVQHPRRCAHPVACRAADAHHRRAADRRVGRAGHRHSTAARSCSSSTPRSR